MAILNAITTDNWKGIIMSDKIELKPCPFCGEKAEIGLNFGRLGVACTICEANMRLGKVCGDFDEESLIEAWNKRT
jgi:Lar family restriction alleviation protein